MNQHEVRMVNILKELKTNYGALNVRAEFEAEGTRLDELLRLKEISMAAGLGLTLKIGGCESLRDMLEARTVGVNCIAAPMVESAYALKKYLMAIGKVFPPEERANMEVLCDIETISACQNFNQMMSIPEINCLNGIVMERIDLCFSQGMEDWEMDDPRINEQVEDVLKKAKVNNLTTTIGGGVSAGSLAFFRKVADGLDRFETRKVTFDASRALAHHPDQGILKALAFEVLWLENKTAFHQGIREKDNQRMELLKQMYGRAINF